MLYSWGELGPTQFFIRLGGLWLMTFTVLGAPIAAASFNPSRVSFESQPLQEKMCLYTVLQIIFSFWKLLQEPLRFVLAAGTGTLFLVSLIVLRIYLVLFLDFPCFSQLYDFPNQVDWFVSWLCFVFRDGVMLVIDYFLQLCHTKRADGMMDKCGWNHQRLAFLQSLSDNL